MIGLFSCRHSKLSMPITMKRTPGAAEKETYQVCLDCGQELEYDLATMQLTGKQLRGATA